MRAAPLMLQQTGEFLANSGSDLVLRPVLAESWTPNQDGSVWTFKIRQGVKFHNGATMTADDVVATIDRLADPKNASNALSAFTGVLSKGGAKKIDDQTVEFHLDAPNGNFPYYLSSDNYNAIILPKDYAGDFERTSSAPALAGKLRQGRASFTPQRGWLGARRRCQPHGVGYSGVLPGAGAPGPSDRHHQPASHVPGDGAGE
jgi:ABC-type transport system substrate-binding protein